MAQGTQRSNARRREPSGMRAGTSMTLLIPVLEVLLYHAAVLADHFANGLQQEDCA
jgi:hypothetical protein